MNKLLLTCVVSAFAQFAWSQIQVDKMLWHLTIIDSANSKGISGAILSVSNGNHYVTDTSGRTDITKHNINNNDSIRISCIGYKTLIFKVSGKYPDTLRIAASIYALNEVTINSSSRKMVLGNAKNQYVGGYLPGPDQEIAEYIPNNGNLSGVITSIEFALLDDHKGIKKPFKVNLYSKSKDSLYPLNELIKDSIVVYNPGGLSTVSVDISKYHIQIPKDGLFVSFQTLSSAWYGPDKIQLNGREFFRTPGIKGVFKNRQFNFDEQVQEGLKYSLLRNISKGAEWSKFEYGTDFAIGVTISP